MAGGVAQDSSRSAISRWIQPGSDQESYLRSLQAVQLVVDHPWSVRAFSAVELRRLAPQTAEHPWRDNPSLRAATRVIGRFRVELAPLQVQSWYNTTFPYGMNDGAVWVGRGLTSAVSGGAALELGPVEMTLAPTFFWTENRSFPLLPVPPGVSPYADGVYPTGVDRPQRFGDGPYARGDAGESSIRAQYSGVSIGLSNERQWWGPMSDFPLILGTNAPGFAHAFIGSDRTFNVYVGRAHARVLYARLEQSAFSPDSSATGRRFAGGFIAVLAPRVFPGLEVGAIRFYHIVWPEEGITGRYFTHLFESFLKNRVKPFNPTNDQAGSSVDNQLASVFARWAMPRSGFELYGEYGREDHNANTTDLVLEPDHGAAFGLGARKTWGTPDRLIGLRAEIVDLRTSTLHRHRPGEAWYRHEYARQGHTNRGQLLAVPFGIGGGAGATLVVERYGKRGLDRVSYSRFTLSDRPTPAHAVAAQHVVRVERRQLVSGKAVELQGALDVVYELNGNGTERWNGRLGLSANFHSMRGQASTPD